MSEPLNPKPQGPLEVIRAFEDQVRLLRTDVENLTNISLNKDEATILRRDLDATLISVKRAVVENEETTRGYS